MKVGTFVRGSYIGSQYGSMLFICAYRSGNTVWFLGTDFTVGTRSYNTTYNYKSINNDSLKWSDACGCTWTVYLYLRTGAITVENCKIPTQSDANMINRWVRNNGFPYWTSTKYEDTHAYYVHEYGPINHTAMTFTDLGVVPLAKVSL